jgi:predicted DNA-binding protein YlxM (UPF0122 family)
MKKLSWEFYIASGLALLAIFFLFLHYYLFHDLHNIFYYLLLDVAFMFIQVLLVTVIIHRLLNEREKKGRLEKLNMVIGAFFSETGKNLLSMLTKTDPGFNKICDKLTVKKEWVNKDFSEAVKRLKDYTFNLDLSKTDFPSYKEFLHRHRIFLLRIIENPTLLEHESFTELLLAVFHATEEFEARTDLLNLSKADEAHITIDLSRVYKLLISEWLDYLKYLSAHYPSLYSLAVRTNPINPKASAIIPD